MKKFKVGDKVKVLRRGSLCSHHCGSCYIGEIGTIKELNYDGIKCHIYVYPFENSPSGCSAFNISDLELVEKLVKNIKVYGIVNFMKGINEIQKR